MDLMSRLRKFPWKSILPALFGFIAGVVISQMFIIAPLIIFFDGDPEAVGEGNIRAINYFCAGWGTRWGWRFRRDGE